MSNAKKPAPTVAFIARLGGGWGSGLTREQAVASALLHASERDCVPTLTRVPLETSQVNGITGEVSWEECEAPDGEPWGRVESSPSDLLEAAERSLIVARRALEALANVADTCALPAAKALAALEGRVEKAACDLDELWEGVEATA